MQQRDIRSVVIFVALAFGLAWLVALPLWLGEGLSSPNFTLVSVGMMFTPTIATVIVVYLIDKPADKARTLGLWPVKPVPRFIGNMILALIIPIFLVLIALPVGSLLGVYPADFQNFSAFREILEQQLANSPVPVPELPPIGMLVLVQLIALPVGAVLNIVPALGEELGWRGWLLPKLLPLGTIPALLISGVIWGLWHAPLILLGYNYPTAPGWLGVLMMTGMCIVVGAVFSWLRIRSGSVWPAALAHGALNAAAGSFLLFAQAGEQVDTTQATILGWSGWIVPLAFVGALLAVGAFTPHRSSAAS